MYIPVLFSSVLAVLPVFPSFLLSIPFAIHLYMLKNQLISAASLLVIHLAAYWVVDPVILSGIKQTNPYITALRYIFLLAGTYHTFSTLLLTYA